MKNKNVIRFKIAKKRHENTLRRERKKRLKVKSRLMSIYTFKESLGGGKITYDKLLDKYLPTNISFLLNNSTSDFNIKKLLTIQPNKSGNFKVPKHFSLIDKPKESYKFIQEVTAALITQSTKRVQMDYSECESIDLEAQVFLDIILKDIVAFYNKIANIYNHKIEWIGGININHENIEKLLFSVGSPAIHSNKTVKFKDIIPYKLCIHDRESNQTLLKISEQKDIDTTTLVDYVLECLKRLGKKLTPDSIDNLCTVIGEILINAEEHSTTKYRFSIGYFQEINQNGKHFGVFRLVIMNFGKTIYEKFKDPLCPNPSIVHSMEKLSKRYTKKKFFFEEFEEETLWTLYALQEGVTSIAPSIYKKRGNGSIGIIDSFFNIKGKKKDADDISRMALISGNTNIIFDGTYNIVKGINSVGEPVKIMTFNNSGNIEDKPDSKFVKFVENYFPGTITSAKILFNEDDLTHDSR